MPDFSDPRYESYVQLCRKLRLERKFQEGDWYQYDPPPNERTLNVVGGVICYHGDLDDMAPAANERCIWLPTLADWLEMLEEAGAPDITLLPNDAGTWSIGRPRIGFNRRDSLQLDPWAAGSTREEAAAKLWMAVTRTEVPA